MWTFFDEIFAVRWMDRATELLHENLNLSYFRVSLGVIPISLW